MRSTLAAGCVIAVVGASSLAVLASQGQGNSGDAGPFAISFASALSAQPLDGRVLLFISDDGRREPKSQSDQYRASSTRPIFGVDVDGLQPGDPIILDAATFGWPLRSLKDLPPGEYWVQALVNRYET